MRQQKLLAQFKYIENQNLSEAEKAIIRANLGLDEEIQINIIPTATIDALHKEVPYDTSRKILAGK